MPQPPSGTLNRRAALGLFAAGIASVGACTQTRYLVQNPDGTYSELDTPEGYTASDDVLSVEVHPVSPYYVVGEPVYLMIVVEGEQAPVARTPMSIGLVLDRSGSMHGGKLEGAKDAAAQVVDHLQDGDRLSLASYATGASVDLPTVTIGPRTRLAFRAALDRLEPGGGTNIEAGMRTGFGNLRGHSREGLSRMVLLSDGRATVGETSHRRLAMMADGFAGRGVSMTTMGLGYDYNDALMTTLAVAGAGNYYYVEHARGLTRRFRDELVGFGATVGRDVELLLELPDGVQAHEVYGYRYEQRGRQLRVRLSDVGGGKRQRLMIALRPTHPAYGPGGQPVTLARPSLVYRSQHGSNSKRRHLPINPVALIPTRDRQRMSNHVNVQVVEKLETVRNASARRQVLDHLGRGDVGGAQRVLTERYRQGSAVNRQVSSKAVARQLRALDDLRHQLRQAPAPSSRGYKDFRKRRSQESFDMYRR